MNEYDLRFDLSSELQNFYEKNKDKESIRDWNETLKKSKKIFQVNFLKNKIIGDDIALKTGRLFTVNHNDKDFIFSYNQKDIFFYKTYLIFTQKATSRDKSVNPMVKVNYSNFFDISLKKEKNNSNSDVFNYNYKVFKSTDFYGFDIITDIDNLIRDGVEAEFKKIDKENEVIKKKVAKEYAQERFKGVQERFKKVQEFNSAQENILKELDKDGNGEVDVIEGNDFSLLLKKHQKSIIEIDRTYIQQFVKVSSYLKTKKNNIQSMFDSIKDTSNKEELNEYVGILKNEIHSYSLILFNALNMIVSLVKDDMITFYEIHDSFDKLNIFNSNWENEISQKLTNIEDGLSNIGDGLSNLMYSVEEMGQNISNEIGHLSYVTEESNRMLSDQLQDIDSSIQTNNLLTGIQTYQMYKINKNTKGLNN